MMLRISKNMDTKSTNNNVAAEFLDENKILPKKTSVRSSTSLPNLMLAETGSSGSVCLTCKSVA
jgi:hypothetical protein